MSDEQKRSLVRKLAEVMAAVDRIPKSGHNNFHNYDYAMEADITSAVRGELAKRHVMLIPSVTKTEFIEGKNAKGNVERIYTVTARFTFHDGESGETIGFDMVGQGSDPSDKGLFKCLTGVVKYAIMKTFLIPTGDDPEKEEAKPVATPAKAAKPAAPKVESAQVPKPSPEDVTTLVNAFAALGVTVADLEKRLGWPLGTMSGNDIVGLRKYYAQVRDAKKDPDEAARQAVQKQAEAAFKSAEKSLGISPVAKPTTVEANATFKALVERINAAKSEAEAMLIQAEGVNLKLSKGDMAALLRAVKDRAFILSELAKGPAEKPQTDVPF